MRRATLGCVRGARLQPQRVVGLLRSNWCVVSGVVCREELEGRRRVIGRVGSPFVCAVEDFVPCFFFSRGFRLFVSDLGRRVFLFMVMRFALDDASFAFRVVVFEAILRGSFLHFVGCLVEGYGVFGGSVCQGVCSDGWLALVRLVPRVVSCALVFCRYSSDFFAEGTKRLPEEILRSNLCNDFCVVQTGKCVHPVHFRWIVRRFMRVQLGPIVTVRRAGRFALDCHRASVPNYALAYVHLISGLCPSVPLNGWVAGLSQAVKETIIGRCCFRVLVDLRTGKLRTFLRVVLCVVSQCGGACGEWYFDILRGPRRLPWPRDNRRQVARPPSRFGLACRVPKLNSNLALGVPSMIICNVRCP